MLTALLDTSTDHAVFAINREGEQVFHREKRGRFGASVILPEMLCAAQDQGFQIKDIKHWIIGKGPGSFTGTRVGIAFVQGIASGSKSIMRGSNSGYVFLPALLKKFPDAMSLAVLHDGRRQEAIVNVFNKVEGKWIENNIFICKLNEISEKCSAIDALTSPMTEEQFAESAESIADKTVFAANAAVQGLLLDPSPMPADELEEINCLKPIYVRPPVFVAPLKTRNL